MNLRKEANYINAVLFDDTLDLSDIHFKNLNFLEAQGVSWIQFDGKIEFYGITLKMEKKDLDIFVGICTDTGDLKRFDILVHELIHVWELQNGYTMGHGKRFLSWCRKAVGVFYKKC